MVKITAAPAFLGGAYYGFAAVSVPVGWKVAALSFAGPAKGDLSAAADADVTALGAREGYSWRVFRTGPVTSRPEWSGKTFTLKAAVKTAPPAGAYKLGYAFGLLSADAASPALFNSLFWTDLGNGRVETRSLTLR